MAANQPHRWARLLYGSWTHHAVLELRDLAPIGDLWLGPQRFHQFPLLQEPSYAAFSGDLKLGVMLLTAQPDAQHRPATAQVVQGSYLVRDVDRVVHGQHQH